MVVVLLDRLPALRDLLDARLRRHASFILVAVLAPVGSNIKGHQAWFQLPGGFTLQPSELAKFGIIVALAGYCNQYRGELDAWRLTVIIGARERAHRARAAPARPRHRAGARRDHRGAARHGRRERASSSSCSRCSRSPAVYAVVGLGLLKQYQIDRLTTFLDPRAAPARAPRTTRSSRTRPSPTAGSTGEGFEQGSQTQGGFVPEQHTDFIFTVGGGGARLRRRGRRCSALFAIVMWRTWRTARLARDFFGTLVCVGVLAMLAFQIFENVGHDDGDHAGHRHPAARS